MVADAVSQSVPMQPLTCTTMTPVGNLLPSRMRVGLAASCSGGVGGILQDMGQQARGALAGLAGIISHAVEGTLTLARSSGVASSLVMPLTVKTVQVHVSATSPPLMQVGRAASALMVSEVL